MPNDLSFKLDGLNGASCVACAGRAIGGVRDARAVSVNLATEEARVSGGSTPEIAAALSAAGYPAREVTIDLAIEGMSCASCVGRVERA